MKSKSDEEVQLQLTPDDILADLEELIDETPTVDFEMDHPQCETYIDPDAPILNYNANPAFGTEAEILRRETWRKLVEKFEEDFNFNWTRELDWRHSEQASTRVELREIEQFAIEASLKLGVASSR